VKPVTWWLFVLLFLAAAIPWPWTARPEPYLFGWLPFPLFYWWVLVVLNFIYILWAANEWLRSKRGKAK
jgi:hypothetical protein